MSEYDVVIIGGGAAGLSAALVLARALRSVALVDGGEPRNAPATSMHGFLSRDGLPPRDLLAAGRAEVMGYGGHLIDGKVAKVAPVPDARFEIALDSGARLTARRILVATGLRDVLPDIDGVRERWGRDVLHCPYCHGYEVRDQALGVLGGTPESVQHALLIRQWSSDLVYFAHTTNLTAHQREQFRASGVHVVDGGVRRVVVADDRLQGIEIADGTIVRREAVFVRPEFVPNDTILADLGCVRDDNGWVAIDATGRTSVPGVWVAGNAANPRAQVITAAGEGSSAAIAINADLVDAELMNEDMK